MAQRPIALACGHLAAPDADPTDTLPTVLEVEVAGLLNASIVSTRVCPQGCGNQRWLAEPPGLPGMKATP